MRFGTKLQSSVYEPWKESYLHYPRLKTMLYEGQSEEEWGERNESRFVEELDSELEKVASTVNPSKLLIPLQIYAFQSNINQEMEKRIGELEKEVEGYTQEGKPLDPRVKTRIIKDLDEIVEEIKELEKFSRINFTGFMKVSSHGVRD
jgi:SPX domain protein involved in polyphosphate accumulation